MDIQDQIIYKLGSIEAMLKTALQDTTDHDERITSLEQWKYWLLGAAASVSLVVSAGAAILHG